MITLSFCENKESAISIEIPCLFTLNLIVWDPFPYEIHCFPKGTSNRSLLTITPHREECVHYLLELLSKDTNRETASFTFILNSAIHFILVLFGQCCKSHVYSCLDIVPGPIILGHTTSMLSLIIFVSSPRT